MRSIEKSSALEFDVQNNSQNSLAVEELFELARNEFWNFSVLGQAPFPTQSIRLKDWLIIPTEQDTSQIPPRAMARVHAIFDAGIRPKGFVIVHEAPMLLPAPKEDEHNFLETIDWEKIRVASSHGLLAVAKVVGAIATGIIWTVSAMLSVGLGAMDPILIAVTEDDYWIEIDRWDE